MKTADEILHEHGIAPPPPGKHRYYTTCPQCSANRSRAHQKAACLGVTVKGDGVTWGCNHCLWTGGGYFNGKINGPGGEPARTYDYLDEQGKLLSQKVRNPPGSMQRFWQRRPDGKGGWINNTQGVRKVLYRLPELLEAIASERTILVVEGEKDADSLWRIGIPATCSPDGASDIGKAAKWRVAYSESLRGADLVVIPDHDDAGYAHASATAKASVPVAKRVRLLTLAKHWPECPKGGDISDWLVAGHTGKELAKLIETAPDYVPPEGAKKEASAASNGNGIDDATEFERLARLVPLDYDRARKDAGKRLGISRLALLDDLVKAKRAELGIAGPGDAKQGRAISLPEPEPWPELVDGPTLLDDIAAALKRYVIMAEHARHVTALWSVHTYLLDCFLISPRLAIRSPMKRCGKTTLLDVLGWLVWRPLPTANVSAAALFRVVEAYRPTLLVDEADTFLGEADELRGVLNSGHRKGGQVLRTVGDDHEPRAFATYSAVAIGIIGNLPDTLGDRSIAVDLKRKLASEAAQSFRIDRVGHLEVLARKTARWTADNADRITEADPAMPDGLFNREADNWRPLFAIAAAAGGEWPRRAREAATQAAAGSEAASLVELLLGDIRDIFAKRKENKVERSDEIPSADLVGALVVIEGHPWAELGKNHKALTQNRLARLLKPLGIAPDRIGPEGSQARGYCLSQFTEAFGRYLVLEGASKPSNRQECDEQRTSSDFATVKDEPGLTVGKCEEANNNGLLDGLTVRKGGKGKERDIRTYLTFLGTEPFAPCTHCGKTGGVVHHVRDNRNLARPSVPLHEDCVADWFAAAEPAPPAGGGSMGLSVHTIRELAGEYRERLYSQYQERGSTDVDSRPLDAWLRQRLAALGVFREHIDAELARVMDVVFAI